MRHRFLLHQLYSTEMRSMLYDSYSTITDLEGSPWLSSPYLPDWGSWDGGSQIWRHNTIKDEGDRHICAKLSTLDQCLSSFANPDVAEVLILWCCGKSRQVQIILGQRVSYIPSKVFPPVDKVLPMGCCVGTAKVCRQVRVQSGTWTYFIPYLFTWYINV